jgi:cyclase
MLARRIIPCLDVRDGRVVKGTQFRDHEDVGDIIELAQRYRDEGADELVFYDITASSDGRTVSTEWVTRVARVLDIPFCVAGGIRSLDGARRILHGGADKISINSPALENPALIGELAREFGSQCVVVGIDSRQEDGDYFVKQYTGDPSKTRSTRWRTLDWAAEAQKLGAGEVVLNCMNQDGMKRGYDIAQLKLVRAVLTIPLVSSGGAGEMSHFNDAFRLAGVDGALAASVFHKGIISIPKLKEQLIADGIPIRP